MLESARLFARALTNSSHALNVLASAPRVSLAIARRAMRRDLAADSVVSAHRSNEVQTALDANRATHFLSFRRRAASAAARSRHPFHAETSVLRPKARRNRSHARSSLASSAIAVSTRAASAAARSARSRQS